MGVPTPDFELAATLGAARLVVRVPPEVATGHEPGVAVEHERFRRGLPAEGTAAGGEYFDVAAGAYVSGSVEWTDNEHEPREVA
jgi:hypothetical protein